MELRLSKREDGKPELSGHIAVFNQLSVDFGGWRERVAPGAFAETIKLHDIRALWNHIDDLVLGRNKAGTLDLEEDEVGLKFRNDPPDTTWFKDRMVSIERKDVTGCSFGFFTDEDEWGSMPDGARVRTLKKCTLVEVSPGVTFPAYPQTDVAVRSMEAWVKRGGASHPPDPQFVVQMELRRRRLQLQGLALLKT
jgi:HK97 family phage prohead protease